MCYWLKGYSQANRLYRNNKSADQAGKDHGQGEKDQWRVKEITGQAVAVEELRRYGRGGYTENRGDQ